VRDHSLIHGHQIVYFTGSSSDLGPYRLCLDSLFSHPILLGTVTSEAVGIMTRLRAGGRKNPGSIPSMGMTFSPPKHVQTDYPKSTARRVLQG
jgi:hypothetical protein